MTGVPATAFPIPRRALLRLAALAAADFAAGFERAYAQPAGERKVVLLTVGGIRRQESFSADGAANIPHLLGDMAPHALFYPYVMNDGVTSHVNTISSIITGKWQQLDDWGARPPAEPTLLACLQDQRGLKPRDTWVVSSNKAVTKNVAPGTNFVLAKQMMIEAVERIILGQTTAGLLTRANINREMSSIFLGEYERIGWRLPSESLAVNEVILDAFNTYFDGDSTGGDTLTYTVAEEVLRRVSPAFMMINFSGMEVAHSGTYSYHLAGIRAIDTLGHRLWRFLQTDPGYKGRTTLIIMPEFGRDPDGSSTNGFFNHRSDTNTCRMTWMMVLGAAAPEPRVEERVIRQTDLAPTLGALLGVDCKQSTGRRLDEFAL